MFDHIGRKIKALAKALFYIEAIGALFPASFVMANDSDMIPLGLLILAGGVLIAWISSWFLYGFGELIDKTCEIAENTRKTPQEERVYKAQSELDRLNDLLQKGLISPEEYAQAAAKYNTQ